MAPAVSSMTGSDVRLDAAARVLRVNTHEGRRLMPSAGEARKVARGAFVATA